MTATSQRVEPFAAYKVRASQNASEEWTQHVHVENAEDASVINYNGTNCTKKWANISPSASGLTPIVAGVTSKKILVMDLVLNSYGNVNATICDEDGNTLKGPWHLLESAGAVLNENRSGWLLSPTGKGISLKLSDAIQVTANISYLEV